MLAKHHHQTDCGFRDWNEDLTRIKTKAANPDKAPGPLSGLLRSLCPWKANERFPTTLSQRALKPPNSDIIPSSLSHLNQPIHCIC